MVPTWSQTRAKSKTLRPQDLGVIVRLLKDIPKFGRKGKENCHPPKPRLGAVNIAAELTEQTQRRHFPRRAWSDEERMVPLQEGRVHDACAVP